MKKFINDLLVLIIKQVFEAYKHQALEKAKVELVKKFIMTTDATRIGVLWIVVILTLILSMALSAVLFLIGLILFFVSIFNDNIPEYFDSIFLIVTIIPALVSIIIYHFIFNRFLSEEFWLQTLKDIPLIGPLVTDVLDKAKARHNKE